MLTLPKREICAAIPDDIEIFAIGDVHGRGDTLRKCLAQIKEVPRQDGVKRLIIFLGDLIDRGPDSLGAVRAAMDAAELCNADERIILPGNHELMMIDAFDGMSQNLWLGNGGRTVMAEIDPNWMRTPWVYNLPRLEEGLPAGFLECIEAAPSHYKIGDLLFVHAGLSPDEAPEDYLDRANPEWAWIRNDFLTATQGWTWNTDLARYEWGNTIVVHGHTPAIRERLDTSTDELQIMDGIDTHRTLCLDAYAHRYHQVGWAHFQRDAGKTLMQVCVSITEDPNDLDRSRF